MHHQHETRHWQFTPDEDHLVFHFTKNLLQRNMYITSYHLQHFKLFYIKLSEVFSLAHETQNYWSSECRSGQGMLTGCWCWSFQCFILKYIIFQSCIPNLFMCGSCHTFHSLNVLYNVRWTPCRNHALFDWLQF